LGGEGLLEIVAQLQLDRHPVGVPVSAAPTTESSWSTSSSLFSSAEIERKSCVR
jgi:hypothetical protein